MVLVKFLPGKGIFKIIYGAKSEVVLNFGPINIMKKPFLSISWNKLLHYHLFLAIHPIKQ
jgi:hypothetical protein